MTIEAELFDGTILEFPEGTPPDVVQRVAKEQTAQRRATSTPVQDGVPVGGVGSGLPVDTSHRRDTIGDTIGTAVSRVAGAPVDTMNDLFRAVGVPTSEEPFLGARQIEGMWQGATGSRETREIEAATPGLTRAGGAPLGQRAYSSFLNTPEARDLHLSNEYGPEGEGWYRMTDQFGNPTDRAIVRNADGTENIFNPPGLDMGDVASMAGGVPDLVGAIMGGAASVPAYAFGPAVGIGTTAGASAAGAQAVGESVGRLFPENRAAEPSIAADVLPRAANEALIDTIMGAGAGFASRGVTGASNYVRAPFARSASDPMAREYRAASDRLAAQGYDIAPLPSEAGAGGFVPRMEGFLEKLPGSSERMRAYREGGDSEIARFQGDVAGGANPVQTGRNVAAELTTQRQNLVIDRETNLVEADRMIGANEQALTNRQGPQMGAEAAGQQTRAGLGRARQEFRDEAKRLYDAARALPGGQDPIVGTQAVRQQVEAIRAELPPEAMRTVQRDTGFLDAAGRPITRTERTGGGPSPEFTPQGLQRFLSGVDDIAETITLDQARQMRTLVNEAINDKTILPGVPERYLSQLSRSLTSAIDGSVAQAGSPELRQALTTANDFYRTNVDQFSRRGVAETFRDPTQPGYVEDNQIGQRLLSGAGRPGQIRDMKRTMGENSPEWAATRRNAVEQILDTGRDQTRFGRRVVNADALVDRLNRLDDETVTELFGVADAQQLRALAADVSNRAKYLEADAFSQQGSPNIMAQLRSAASAEEQIGRDFRDSVVAPFLRGENGAAARLNPAELVPWLYRQASPDDVRQVMGRLPQSLRADVEKATVADIIENAISRGRGDISAVRRLVSGESNPADSQDIAAMLGVGGDTASRQQADRINALLSKDSQQALRDLALITARRQERDATTAAVGGLAAGAAVTNILSSPGSALRAGIVARGLSELIVNPAFRRWVTNTKQRQLSPNRLAMTVAGAPAAFDVASAGLAENEDINTALAWINEGVSQIDEQGRRAARPPSGASSWEDYFSGQTSVSAADTGASADELRRAVMGGSR